MTAILQFRAGTACFQGTFDADRKAIESRVLCLSRAHRQLSAISAQEVVQTLECLGEEGCRWHKRSVLCPGDETGKRHG